MSQDFTDDCFASGHVGQTDLQNMEKNFAALKSTFSGPSAPSNTVAGMWWYDTNANILKLRNEANNAWLEVYDFANETVPDNKVDTDAIQDDAITNAKVADNAVNTAQIVANAVTAAKMAAGVINWILFDNKDVTAQSEIEFTGLDDDKRYLVVCHVRPSAATPLWLQVCGDGTATYYTASNSANSDGTGGASGSTFGVWGSVGVTMNTNMASGQNIMLKFEIMADPADKDLQLMFGRTTGYANGGPFTIFNWAGRHYKASTTFSSLKILPGSGTITGHAAIFEYTL